MTVNTYITNINTEIPEYLIEIALYGYCLEPPICHTIPESTKISFKKLLIEFVQLMVPVLAALVLIEAEEKRWTVGTRDPAIRALWLGNKDVQDRLIKIFGPNNNNWSSCNLS